MPRVTLARTASRARLACVSVPAFRANLPAPWASEISRLVACYLVSCRSKPSLSRAALQCRAVQRVSCSPSGSHSCHPALTHALPHTLPKGRASRTPACNSTAFHRSPTRADGSTEHVGTNSFTLFLTHTTYPLSIAARIARSRPSPPVSARLRRKRQVPSTTTNDSYVW